VICRLLLTILLAVIAPVVTAASRVWVEAQIEPATVPVNAQATYVLRFGHAVDVRAIRFTAPHARLAEVLALGPQRQFEVMRDGIRHRVHEQRFAVLPFASGDIMIDAAINGTTSAILSELAARKTFTLAPPQVALRVSPAVPGSDWVPARALRLAVSGDPPIGLGVGGVWTRELLVEADGVDGSVIAAPRWIGLADWTVQFDPPVSGRRVESGRLIGYRKQTVHVQPTRAGRLTFPAVEIDWWQVDTAQWTRSSIAGVEVMVPPASTMPGAPSRAASSVSQDGPTGSPEMMWPVAVTAGILLASILAWRSERLRRVLHRRRRWRELRAACRSGDARRARGAMLEWLRISGMPLRSLETLAALGSEDGALRRALEELDEACYGRGCNTRPWDGAMLPIALRELK